MDHIEMQENYEVLLCQLPIGRKAMVTQLCAEGITRRRLLDLGLIENGLVEAIRKSPLGDPVAYKIRGALIALRREESSRIRVRII